MNIKTALISDFDGTLTPEDFFWYVSERWLDAEALEPWQRYLDGKLSHLEALNLIFSRILKFYTPRLGKKIANLRFPAQVRISKTAF